MRAVLVVVLGALLVIPVLQAEDTAGRLPLVLLDAVRTGNPGFGASLYIGVGSLDGQVPAGAYGHEHYSPSELQYPYRLHLDNTAGPLKALQSGKLKLALPGADKSTVVLLKLSCGDNHTTTAPVALTRSGNHFTLTLEHWYDNGERDKTYPVEHEYLVDLGKLPAGDYELNIELNFLLQDVQKHPNGDLHEMAARETGALSFTVGATAVAGKPPALDALKKSTEALSKEVLEVPYFATGSAPRDEHPNPGVYAGALDVKAWLESNRLKAPQITPATQTDPIYALVVGPLVNSGEHMELRAMRWEGSKCTLVVELWRDSGVRDRNVPSHPVMVVPVRLPATVQDGKRTPDASTFKIAVEWVPLRAANAGAPYVPDSTDELVALKKLENERAVETAGAGAKPAAVSGKSDF